MSDSASHILSLKVMRVSRPALSAAWEPFYSTSSSFSAHSSTTITSLQGSAPLAGHPKTLRDLSQPNELLMLPASFGSISLGETFESCLCVNNDAHFEVHQVSLRVEMQTATSKVTLAELGGPDCTLQVGSVLEEVVRSEMTELGQHVLGCTVTYHLPSHPDGLVTFRKFYKFNVTNPLSVKTKVHTVRSPSALYSAQEREKLFMQVHVQNLTPEPVWFERIIFECVRGWSVEDVDNSPSSIFNGPSALMQPQDIRQYVYILTPTTQPPVPPHYAPGSLIPLGKMDIAWRSSFGEPGRLVTSTLTRRIPLVPPAQPPASALPLHLKRTAGTSIPPRPQSPVVRTATPPIVRPGSPFRSSTTPRPPSPVQTAPSTAHSDIDLHLTIRQIPRDNIRVNEPFSIDFSLHICTPGHAKGRTFALLVQHVQYTTPIPVPVPSIPSQSQVATPTGAYTPRTITSGSSTPSTTNTFNYPVAHQRILSLTRQSETNLQESLIDTSQPTTKPIPPPFSQRSTDDPTMEQGVLLLGRSAIPLPDILLADVEDPSQKQVVERQFSMQFLPTKQGFVVLGGLRVVLAGEKSEENEELRNVNSVLQEWKSFAEIFVKSS